MSLFALKTLNGFKGGGGGGGEIFFLPLKWRKEINSQGKISQKKDPDIRNHLIRKVLLRRLKKQELPGDSLSLGTASSFLMLSISEDFKYVISFHPDSTLPKKNPLYFTKEETDAQGAETICSKVK